MNFNDGADLMTKKMVGFNMEFPYIEMAYGHFMSICLQLFNTYLHYFVRIIFNFFGMCVKLLA